MEPILVALEKAGVLICTIRNEGEEFGFVLEGSIILHLGEMLLQGKKGRKLLF